MKDKEAFIFREILKVVYQTKGVEWSPPIFFSICQGLKVKKRSNKIIVGYHKSNATLKLWLHCDRVHFCAKKTLTDVISVCSLVVIWLGNKTNEMWKRKSTIVVVRKSRILSQKYYKKVKLNALNIRFYLSFRKKMKSWKISREFEASQKLQTLL